MTRRNVQHHRYRLVFNKNIFNRRLCYCCRHLLLNMSSVKIIFWGDSILRRMQSDVLHEPTYTTQNKKVASGHCIGGNKTTQLVKRIKRNRDNFAGHVFVLLIGTNDLLASKPVHSFRQNLRHVVSCLQKLKPAELFICTLPPVHRARGRDMVVQYNDVIRGLGLRMIDVANIFLGKPHYVSRDGVHPTRNALREMHELIERSVAAV